MKTARFFITGTDTDAGKTVVTCTLLEAFRQRGLRTIGLKPVAAGCEEIDGELRNSDALKLQQTMTESLPYEQINPIALREPIAPHIAAQHEGRRLQASRLAGLIRGAAMTPADVVLVEGAGGWLVPLNERQTLADLVRELQYPVILVVGMKLGCLNHALLTARAIYQEGLTMAGWIANCVDPYMEQLEANIQTLDSMLTAPCLGVIPHQSPPDFSKLASSVKTDLLLAPEN